MEKNNIAKQIAKAFNSFVKKLCEFVKNAWNRIKPYVIRKAEANDRFMKDYEKNVARHKHNEYTRSTWITTWDTRKQCQVISNRPIHTVRKVNI